MCIKINTILPKIKTTLTVRSLLKKKKLTWLKGIFLLSKIQCEKGMLFLKAINGQMCSPICNFYSTKTPLRSHSELWMEPLPITFRRPSRGSWQLAAGGKLLENNGRPPGPITCSPSSVFPYWPVHWWLRNAKWPFTFLVDISNAHTVLDQGLEAHAFFVRSPFPQRFLVCFIIS